MLRRGIELSHRLNKNGGTPLKAKKEDLKNHGGAGKKLPRNAGAMSKQGSTGVKSLTKTANNEPAKRKGPRTERPKREREYRNLKQGRPLEEARRTGRGWSGKRETLVPPLGVGKTFIGWRRERGWRRGSDREQTGDHSFRNSCPTRRKYIQTVRRRGDPLGRPSEAKKEACCSDRRLAADPRKQLINEILDTSLIKRGKRK